ncbi:MAG TPA: malto-oligosyltrehalose synthase, partial [Burkholderiales bacterium]
APQDASQDLNSRIREFAMKVQQFTAPVSAKGVEDTAFYRYNRLVSLNDVGGDPEQFGMPVSAFHGATAERAAHRPHTMLATSTHDNKRSEDVRARIDVLSEMPDEWRTLLRRWERMNRNKKVLVEKSPAPDANDEYLLYQTLLGTFAPDDMDASAVTKYCERIQAYMLKAVREAKVHSGWINPDTEYENAVSEFVRALLASSSRNLFLKDLCTRSRMLAWCGMLNSLSMTLLKLASPGVPDIYQGNETSDFSLVDPDNRRAVDYSKRGQLLDQLAQLEKSSRLADDVKRLAASGLDGSAKTWIIWRTLALRKNEPDLFRDSHYVPLQAHGAHAEHVIAFMRRRGTRAVVAVAGRLWMKLGTREAQLPLGVMWGDTAIDAGPLTGNLVNVLTGETVQVREGRIRVGEAMRSFPAALLRF